MLINYELYVECEFIINSCVVGYSCNVSLSLSYLNVIVCGGNTHY